MDLYTHRGLFNNKTIFENTIPAFSKSIEHGFGIELDVRMTKDNVLVVFHDDNCKRMFDEWFKINDLTYPALLKYDLNGSHIPTLSDTLEFIDGRVPIIVEVKEGHDRNLIALKVAEMLDGYDGEFMVESFDPLIVRWFKKHRPQFVRGQLVMPMKKYDNGLIGFIMRFRLTHFLTKPDFYAYEYSLGTNKISRFFLKKFAPKICVWTVKSGREYYFDPDFIIFEDSSLI